MTSHEAHTCHTYPTVTAGQSTPRDCDTRDVRRDKREVTTTHNSRRHYSTGLWVRLTERNSLVYNYNPAPRHRRPPANYNPAAGIESTHAQSNHSRGYRIGSKKGQIR